MYLIYISASSESHNCWCQLPFSNAVGQTATPPAAGFEKLQYVLINQAGFIACHCRPIVISQPVWTEMGSSPTLSATCKIQEKGRMQTRGGLITSDCI